jgi:RecA-family ATPase
MSAAERLARAYGEHRLAVCWTVTNDPEVVDPETGDKLAKTCRTRGWQHTKPYPGPDFAAGEFCERVKARNPGIVAAASGLLCLDLDEGGRALLARLFSEDLPVTVEVHSTPALGKGHLWFRPPDGKPGGVFELGADGVEYWSEKYLLAPPARHPDGHLYAFAQGRGLGEVAIATMPIAAYELLAAEWRGPGRDGPAPSDAPIPKGKRYQDLLSVAGAMRRAGAGEPEIAAALLVRNERLATPPHSRQKVEQLASDVVARYAPGQTPGDEWWWRKGDDDGEGAEGPVFIRLADVTERTIEWFWEGRIPWGMPTLVGGDGGVGKSTMLQDLGARMSRGEGPPGAGGGEPRSVVILSGEEDAGAVIRPRMRLMGADLERVLVLDLDQAGFTLPSGMSRLAAICRDEGAGMVVVDTGPAFMDPGLKSNTEEDIRRVLRPLAALAEELRLVVAVLAHLNKDSTRDSRHRVMGGAAWVNAARSVLLVGPPPGKDAREVPERMVAVEKSNLAAYPPAVAFTLTPAEQDPRYGVISWGGEVPGVRAGDLVSRRPDGEERSEREEAAEFLRTELADAPRPVSEMEAAAKAAGLGWATVKKAKADVGVASKKDSFGGPWMWSLMGAATKGDSTQSPLGRAGSVSLGEKPSTMRVSGEGRPRRETHSESVSLGGEEGLDGDDYAARFQAENEPLFSPPASDPDDPSPRHEGGA